MNISEINALTKASVGKLTSDAYLTAFNDPTTGKQFAEKINQLENAPRTASTEATRPHGNVRGEEPAPTPAATSFDPSFDESPNAPAPAAAAPAAQPAVPGKLMEWRYQPVDSSGRPLGGEQVFRYDPNLPNEDPKSLVAQLTKAHSCATTALKEKKVKEFIDSVGVDGGYVEPKMLTVFDHPEYEKLNAITRTAFNNAVQGALSLFKQRHPEFQLSESNAAAMCQFVAKNHFDPASGASWEQAWTSLKPHLLPDEVEVAPVPTVEIVEPTKVVPTARRGGVPTGLSNIDETSTDEPFVVAPTTVQGVKVIVNNTTQVLDLRAWDKLPSDAQKRILRNPKNAAAIDALYRAAETKRGKR